jgi:hypothetical protein
MPLAIFYIVFSAAVWVVIAVVLRLQTPPRPERETPPAGISTQKGIS